MTLASVLIKGIKEVEKVYNKNVDIKKAYVMDSYGFRNKIENANIIIQVSIDNPLKRNNQKYYEIQAYITKDSIKLDSPIEI